VAIDDCRNVRTAPEHVSCFGERPEPVQRIAEDP
jgi:hypothetical protein